LTFILQPQCFIKSRRAIRFLRAALDKASQKQLSRNCGAHFHQRDDCSARCATITEMMVDATARPKPKLFSGVLKPLAASEHLYHWDESRVESLPAYFGGMQLAPQGELVFGIAMR
jgi:hypothetical protein